MDRLIVIAIPFIIPAFLLASWLVNTKSGTKGNRDSKPDNVAKSNQASSSKSDEAKLSNKDMTSP